MEPDGQKRLCRTFKTKKRGGGDFVSEQDGRCLRSSDCDFSGVFLVLFVCCYCLVVEVDDMVTLNSHKQLGWKITLLLEDQDERLTQLK